MVALSRIASLPVALVQLYNRRYLSLLYRVSVLMQDGNDVLCFIVSITAGLMAKVTDNVHAGVRRGRP